MSPKSELIERVRENVPERLRELPVWLLHDERKHPIYANGSNRNGALDSPADRRSLVKFEIAAEALRLVHRASGLGVALGEVPDQTTGEVICLAGIDLDHCYRNGELEERAIEVICAAQSYCEKSPSGEGVHVLGFGSVGTLRTPGLELYSGQRFFTTTGARLNGAHLADISEAGTFARKLYGADATNGADAETSSATPSDSDYPIITALKASGLYLRNGGNGKHLIRCPWEARHSPNEAGERSTSSTEAAYFTPGAIVRNQRLDHGMFKCQHAHCTDRRLLHLREFLGLDTANGTATATRKLIGVNFADMRPHLSDGYIVKGLVGTNSLTGIIGPTASGKTFFATDLAMHIAAGRAWRGHPVRGGLVIYAALEGPVSAENRFCASRIGREFPPSMPLRLTPGPINLRDTADAALLTEFAREAEAHFGQKTVALFVDTLSRALAGGDENHPEDMGALIVGADSVRLAIGATVFLVHHLGKDESRGARGHSSLKGALDTEIMISGSETSVIEQVRVATVSKQRDLPAGAKYAYKLKAVELGRDTDGDTVTSCVVVPVDQVPSDRKQPTGKHQRTLLTALFEWKRQHPDTPTISTIEFRGIAKAQRMDRRRLQDATEALEKIGWLVPTVGGYRFVSEEQL